MLAYFGCVSPLLHYASIPEAPAPRLHTVTSIPPFHHKSSTQLGNNIRIIIEIGNSRLAPDDAKHVRICEKANCSTFWTICSFIYLFESIKHFDDYLNSNDAEWSDESTKIFFFFWTVIIIK